MARSHAALGVQGNVEDRNCFVAFLGVLPSKAVTDDPSRRSA
jgi:hypothetical protein